MARAESQCHTIGPYLRGIATLLGHNAATIARSIGYSEPTVRQWLSGRRQLTIDNAMLIAKSIDVDFSLIISAYSIGYKEKDTNLWCSEFFKECIKSVFIIQQELGSDMAELRPAHAAAMRARLLEASKAMLDRKLATNNDLTQFRT
jgi:transcriptional regulator with XRE-family HTH domain